MNCPRCNKQMTDDGEWPFTYQKTRMTFQVMMFTCEACSVYIMEELQSGALGCTYHKE